VQYTPGQVRQAVKLTQETLRHWRAVFTFLAGIRGQGASYRPAQILTLAIIKRLVEDCGLSVSALKTVEVQLFDVVQTQHWTVLERGSLSFAPSAGEATFIEGRSAAAKDCAIILLPLGPVISELRVALTGMEVLDAQPSLHFPPVAVTPEAAARARQA
jgi:hypothetical protein